MIKVMKNLKKILSIDLQYCHYQMEVIQINSNLPSFQFSGLPILSTARNSFDNKAAFENKKGFLQYVDSQPGIPRKWHGLSTPQNPVATQIYFSREHR